MWVGREVMGECVFPLIRGACVGMAVETVGIAVGNALGLFDGDDVGTDHEGILLGDLVEGAGVVGAGAEVGALVLNFTDALTHLRYPSLVGYPARVTCHPPLSDQLGSNFCWVARKASPAFLTNCVPSVSN